MEIYYFIDIIERFYILLYKFYKIIYNEVYNLGINKMIIFQIAIKTINNIIKLNDLISTLLIFNTFFYIIKNNPLIPIIQ